MRNKLVVTAVAVLVFAAAVLYLHLSASVYEAEVVRVIDGDTIEISGGERVRLLGIDAQEKDEEFYAAAAGRLREIVDGKTVELEPDVTDRDKYDRLLRYVFADGKFVNLQMVEEGLAYAYVISPDVKYLDEITDAEAKARSGALNIWKDAAGRCMSVDFNTNARGNDNDNLNDEYVAFKNLCSQGTSIEGWKVRDSGGNTFSFPSFVLCGGCVVVLYSGHGEDSGNRLYWGSDIAIWNNGGDKLRLYDSHGNLMIEKSY